MGSGRTAERFSDLDLDCTATKPDNKKRRSKNRRPAGYYGGWERNQTVKAKEIKMHIKKVRKRIGRYAKTHPEYKRHETVVLLGIVMKRYGFSLWGGGDVRTVLQERLAQGGQPQTCPVKACRGAML